MTYSGQPIKRVEDRRLLTGESSYVDDLKLPGMIHASVLRSPHAHAVIRSIDTVAASSLAGVVLVVTAKELTGAVQNVSTRGNTDADELKPPEHPVLARDKVCYVGQPVAIIVAEDPYLAHDAMQLVRVDTSPCPAWSTRWRQWLPMFPSCTRTLVPILRCVQLTPGGPERGLCSGRSCGAAAISGATARASAYGTSRRDG
jgi:hypothetical protein